MRQQRRGREEREGEERRARARGSVVGNDVFLFRGEYGGINGPPGCRNATCDGQGPLLTQWLNKSFREAPVNRMEGARDFSSGEVKAYEIK